MTEDVVIDWGGFDPVEVPEAPPADVLAAQLDAEAIDQMAIAPAQYDVRKMAITEPNTCQWNASTKVWVARDQTMREVAIDECRAARGVKPKFATPAQTQKANMRKGVPNAGAVAGHGTAGSGYSTAGGGGGSMPISVGGGGGGGLGGHTTLAADIWPDETLRAEMTRRGYTVAKLGALEPLAELLGQQDDEEDPFGKILELLK